MRGARPPDGATGSGRHRRTERDLLRARVRITALTLGSLLIVLFVAGWVVVGIHERALVDASDERMREDAERAGLIVQEGVFAFPASVTHDVRVQVIDREGRLFFASELLRGEPALWQPDQAVGPRTVDSATQGRLRVVTSPFLTGIVLFAEPLEPVDEATRALTTILLACALPLSVALGVVLWVAVGRALRPVRAAVEREEQLVADVSHELRSPIAGIRVLLETEPGDPIEIELSRAEALDALTRLETVTAQLLFLGDHDRGRPVSRRRPVDLDEVVERCIGALLMRTAVVVDTTAVGAGQVVGDADALSSMVGNLLGNAVRHARHVVRISLRERDGSVELTVEDDGPGIPTPQRSVVFERFTRLDEARAHDDGGAGLGLAIVAAVVEGHGGTVALDDSALGGARFVIRLPASTAPPAPGDRARSSRRAPV